MKNNMNGCPYHGKSSEEIINENNNIVDKNNHKLFLEVLVVVTSEILKFLKNKTLKDILAHPRIKKTWEIYQHFDYGDCEKFYHIFGRAVGHHIRDYTNNHTGVAFQDLEGYSQGGFSEYIHKMLQIAFYQFLYLKISSHEYNFDLKRKTYQLMSMYDDAIGRVLGKPMTHDNQLSDNKYTKKSYQKQGCPFLDYPKEIKESLFNEMDDIFEKWYQEMKNIGLQFEFENE